MALTEKELDLQDIAICEGYFCRSIPANGNAPAQTVLTPAVLKMVRTMPDEEIRDHLAAFSATKKIQWRNQVAQMNASVQLVQDKLDAITAINLQEVVSEPVV